MDQTKKELRSQYLFKGDSEQLARHLCRLLDSTAEGFYSVDLKGRCSLINRAAAQMIGYLPEEVLGQDMHSLIHHSHADGTPYPQEQCPLYHSVLHQRSYQAEEEVFWRRDGTAFAVEYSSHPIFEGDVVQGAVVTFSDITERTQTAHTALGQAAVLTRTLNLLASEPAVDTFLGHVLMLINEQLSASSSALWLYDRAQGSVVLHMTCHNGQILTGEQQLGYPDAGKLTQIQGDEPFLQGGQKWLVLEDAPDHPALDAKQREWVQAQDIKTLLYVPLVIGQSNLGSLNIRSRHEGFTAEAIELTQALAQQATLALQLTRLAERSRQAAVLQERNRMAGEIHDSLAQALTGVVVQLGAAERLLTTEQQGVRAHIVHARELARHGLAEARRAVLALDPQAEQYANLHESLALMMTQMTAGTPLRSTFKLHGSVHALSPEIGQNLLRIGQEALTNIIKHAQAREVSIELFYETGQVSLHIRDDGKGFDYQFQAGQGGFGLTSMQDRARRIAAQLKVISCEGEGTEIIAVAPLTGGPAGENHP